MKFKIIVLRRAELALNENALWWAENHDVEQSLRWLDAFEAAIDSLAENPERLALAREDHLFKFPLRQVVFGISRKPTHRALYRVRDGTVLIYLIRHLAQADVVPEDFE